VELRPRAPASSEPAERPVWIPIRVDGPDAAPKRERKPQAEPVARTEAAPAPARASGKRGAPSAEVAAVRLQAMARGFLARRWVRAVRQVEREAEDVGRIVGEKEEALRGSDRARAAAAEVLMKMLLRLDAVRGVREYRRRVTRRVLLLQDAVDALEQPPKAAPAPEETEEEAQAEPAAGAATVLTLQDTVDAIETKATEPEVVAVEAQAAEAEATVVKIADNTGERTERSDADAAEDTGVIELKAAAELEADGGSADGEPGAKEEAEPALDAENLEDGKPDCSDVEWEIVAEEPAEAEPAAATSPNEAAPRQEPAGLEFARAADSGAAGVVDSGNVMEMVALLCELNAQQCAVIAALAERVDALERTVRRMEDADAGRRAEKPSGEAGEATTPSSAAIKV
jgi:hypothetical protein